MILYFASKKQNKLKKCIFFRIRVYEGKRDGSGTAPTRKALRYGLESLSDLELVALILQSGNKNRSVFEIASDVLKESEGLSKLMSMHVKYTDADSRNTRS